MFKLVIQDDEGKTTVVPLIRDEITIGRKEGNTIRLTERNVSRRHARILRNNGEVQIEDLGSYNGIRVNNARIAERVSLRVSDQVQIGDYKLYLKAEGVEQVDDARTMPIERVDAGIAATDVIPAVAAPVAATAPMAAQTPTPGTLPSTSQLVGNPNRTMVAVADTDPQGRPVASAAQVAAVLSSPVGYGKLVVLSANFAGKEFELSRPQMIVGRTDENDIAINHRSISRNHAKLVREPDTGRYTISDLQSSNGVRVNEQDYGKVELRRGDIIDLGHVRLRFVEAGEDFVFSRDAMINNVPDSSSKKGLWIALLAALVVAGGVVAFMVLKDGNKPTTGGVATPVVTADASNPVAQTGQDAGGGSDTDASGAVAATDDAGRIRLQCAAAKDAKKWDDLITCAETLRKVDKSEGDKFYTAAHAEQRAEARSRAFKAAMDDGALKKAKDELDQIDQESVYFQDSEARYKKAAADAKLEIVARLKKVKNDCKVWKQAADQETASKPRDLVEDAKREVPCATVAAKEPPPKDTKEPKEPKETPPPKETTPKEPVEKCNPEELISKGQEQFSGNNNVQALTFFEQAYKCRPDANALKFVFASACKSKNTPKAKSYWKRMGQGMKDTLLTFCVGNGITVEILNGP